MNRPPKLATLVLAAGAATRFGTPKALALLDGKRLIQHAIERALEVSPRSTWVVLGHGTGEVTRALPSGEFTVVVNRRWQEGMASSIRAGVERLPGVCGGALLLLADQPRITRESLRRLVDAWLRQPTQILASRYAGVMGAPCIFPRWCFTDLLTLRGDQGARSLLNRYTERVVAVAHPEAAADVDNVEDLAALGEQGGRIETP